MLILRVVKALGEYVCDLGDQSVGRDAIEWDAPGMWTIIVSTLSDISRMDVPGIVTDSERRLL